MKWRNNVPPTAERDDEKQKIEKRLSDIERRLKLLEAEAALLRRES